ncbi:MAG: exodeoxyribonuclease III [Elusimicrobia bacterium]|nr:exodeoxyribonuclease III [Elusimicrobiota bacterium]
MKIATFNVNSIRKRMPIVLDWLKANRPDVLCLQETKVEDKDFPAQPILDLGYHVTFRGMKAYNGVATISVDKPEKVVHGFCEGPDSEDFRILQTVHRGVLVINTYVPQGYMLNSPKFQYKLGWYRRLAAYFDSYLTPQTKAVWLGDVNVAPEPIDVANPEKNVNDVCFHVDARNAYKETVKGRFVDVFRQLYPDRVQYTFWDFFRNSFERNKGWRIDHILATPALAKTCKEVDVDLTPRKAETPSDHTVVWADFAV